MALGEIVVEVLDKAGNRLGSSQPLRANHLHGHLLWSGTAPWRPGASTALRFHLTRGFLYSYWFE